MPTPVSQQELERRRKQSLDAMKMKRSSIPSMPVSNVQKTVAEQYASGNRDKNVIGSYKNTSVNGYDNSSNLGKLSQTALDAQKRNELASNKIAPSAEQFAANNANASTVGQAASSGVTDKKVIGSYADQNKPPLEFGSNVATPNVGTNTQSVTPSVVDNAKDTYGIASNAPSTTTSQSGTPTQPVQPTQSGGVTTNPNQETTTQPTTGLSTLKNPTTDVTAYNDMATNAGDTLKYASESALQDQKDVEDNLRKKFLSAIGETTLDETAAGQNVNLNAMSFQELQDYAMQQGFAVDEKFKKQIQAQGASAIDDMKFQLNQDLAINDLTTRQLERNRDKALDEREKFNAMQDVRNRALMGSFGVQDVASNGAVLQAIDEGVKAKEDLVLQFADKLTPIAMNAQSLIHSYNSNVAQINSQGAQIIENKYAEIVGKLQDYADQGVTSKKELRKVMLTEIKDYGKLIGEINDKKLKYVQEENKQFFEQSKFIMEQQGKQDEMYMKGFGVMFKNGVPLLDAQGQQIPTLDNMKFQNEMDQTLTLNSGYIYRNGQPMLDSKGGQIPTFSLQKFNAEENRADRNFGLETSKFMFDQQKFDFDKQKYGLEYAQAQQKTAIEMADKGIVQVQKNMLDPSSGVNPEQSKYGMNIAADGTVVFSNLKKNDSGTYTSLPGRSQCGEFVNDALGLTGDGKMVDLYTDKMKLATSSVPQAGGAFVQKLGGEFKKYGHTGVVTKVYPDGSFDYLDANRDGKDNGIIREGHMTMEQAKQKGITGYTPGISSVSSYEKKGSNSDSILSKIPKEFVSSVTQKVGAFDNEQGVKNYQVALDARNFVRSLPNDTKNPSDDQALIYAFAKVMDPASSVREGEYATVQKYAQSWANQYGSSLNQAISGTGFLTSEARKNIKETLENKYVSQKKSYDSLLGQYTQTIDNMAGNKGIGKELIQDYSAADTSSPRAGFVRGYTPDGKVVDIPENDYETINKAMEENGVSFGS